MNSYDILTVIEQMHIIIKDNKNIETGIDTLMKKLNKRFKMSISDFQILLDAIDKDSILNTKNKELCKQCICNWRDRLCVDDLIAPKDIYMSLWKCRDFELSHLWQRSIFLTTFLVICFTGYGCALMKICDILSDNNISVLLILNIVSIIIALLGIILSLFWIMMGKGSKAWYEKYEKALYNIERNSRYCHTIVTQNMESDEVMHGGLPKTKTNESFFSTDGGSFSVSRINIAIGQVSLVIWYAIYFAHSIFLSFSDLILNSNQCLFRFIVMIIFFSISVVPCILITKGHWCKSNGI